MYLLCLLLINLAIGRCQELVVSNTTLNWTEAVKFCTERKSTLVHTSTTEPLNITEYWTSQQQRMSPWIHIVGCFYETRIHPSREESVTMSSVSVAICQQECSNYTFFGLQNSKCVCLDDSFSVKDAISPGLCNSSCSSTPSAVLNECGGSGTYSIYTAGNLLLYDKTNNETCLAIKCPKEDKVKPFKRFLCSTLTVRCLCRNNSGTVWSVFNWTQCLNKCKLLGYYMYGDFDVYNPQEVCDKMSSVAWVWVGIAKQIYITAKLENMPYYSLLLKCVGCNHQQCTLNSCSEKRHAVCYMDQSPNSSAQENSSVTFPAMETTKQLSSISPPHKTAAYSSKDSKTDITIIAVVVTLVTLSILVSITLIYIKRRKKKNVKEEDQCHNQNGTELFTYDNIPVNDLKLNPSQTVNNAYFTLEPQKEKKKEENYCQDECGYNHLWEVGKEKDREGSNTNLYMGVASFNTKQRDSENEENQVYNHLGEESDDMADDIYDHTTQENEYNTAEIERSMKSNNYDHCKLHNA